MLAKGDMDAAEGIFGGLYQESPDSGLALELARIAEGRGADPAIEGVYEAQRLAPWDPAIRMTLGSMLMDVGRLAEASRVLRPAALVDPRAARQLERVTEALLDRRR